MSPSPLDELHITAIHEAAHAVAAIRAGLVFEQVTVVPDAEELTEGALHWSELQASGTVDVVPELLAVVLLAGPCAEARFTGRELDEVFADEVAGDDREALGGLLLDADTFLRASQDTLQLLERDWPLIEQVAEELWAAETLDYDQVAELVHRFAS